MSVEKAIMYIVFTAIILLVVKVLKQPYKYPPGPRGFPSLTFLFGLLKDKSALKNPYYSFEFLENWRKAYGNIVGVFLGPLSQPVVVVYGAKAVKEALTNPDIQDRPITPFSRARKGLFGLGILFAPGKIVKDQKRFALKKLHHLGYGKSSEILIQEEISEILKKIQNDTDLHPEHIFEFKRTFRQHNVNIMWRLLTGTRLDNATTIMRNPYSNEKQGLRLLANMINSLPIPEHIQNFFPSKIISFLEKEAETYKPIHQLISDIIENHLSKNLKSDTENFIDLYIKEIEKQGNKFGGNRNYNKNQLKANVLDMFEGSLYTTEALIGWFLLYMIHYPEVQQKIQLELDEVCGDGLPLLEHRPRLVYTEATLMEVLRTKTAIPFFTRSTSEKTKLQEFLIPKNSVIYVDLRSVHMDDSCWINPKEFRPERHLTLDGKIKKDATNLMPFGLGARSCIGEVLARQIFFLISSSIVKTFNIQAIRDEPLPSLAPHFPGIILFPKVFKAMVIPRKN